VLQGMFEPHPSHVTHAPQTPTAPQDTRASPGWQLR